MNKKSLASSAAIMASGTLVSRFLGLVRAAMLAMALATIGGAADAFSVANKLPTIIYMLIAGGVLNAVLVPQIVRAMKNSDGGNRYVNQLLTLGATALAGITALLTLGAGILVTIYAASINPEWKPLAITFAYICLPQLFFYGLYTLLGQVLNAKGNFGPYMWAPVLNNVVSIIGLGVYLYLFGEYHYQTALPSDWDATRIWLVAGTATAGIAAQALVLLIPLYRTGFRLAPVFSFRGSGLGRASKVAGWAFAALMVGQLGYLIISNLAVAAGRAGQELGIVVAGNASYDHAFTIFMLPQSLITVSLVTAMFTRLSHHAVSGEAHSVRDQLSMGLRTLAVFTVFATAVLMVFALPIVIVILAGKQDWASYQAIAHVVVAFALGLLPMGAWTMIQRVYFAYEDTRSLFRIQIPMMLIVVGSSAAAYLFFPPQWWVVVGAALGTTLSNTFGAVVAYLALRKKLPSLDGARVLRTHIRLTLAVLPPALITWGLLHLWGVQTGLVGSLVRIAVLGTLMGVGYLVMLRILDVTELDGLLTRVLAMAAPVTRRLSPLLGRIPGGSGLRKIGSFFAPSESRVGVVGTNWNAGDEVATRYRLEARADSHIDGDHSFTHWDAHDTATDKPVRVTILSGDSDRISAAMDGARRSSVLTEEWFPKVLRVVAVDDEAIVVTAPVQGATLTSLIANRTVSAQEVRSIVGEASSALDRAHRQGIQHLALTPHLIVIDEGQVKILGLGYAAALAGITAKSSDLGARKDTISLAHVLIAGITGHWIGSVKVNLPQGSESVASAQELHELNPDAPLDLIRLSYMTVSPFEEGPHKPSEFAENLRPWQPVPRLEEQVMVPDDFITDGFTAIATSEPSPDVTVKIPAVDLADDGPVDPSPLDETVEDDAGNEPDPEPMIEPKASVTAEPRGWDVPQGSEPASVHRGDFTLPAPADEGDSTLGPSPEYKFTPVEPLPTATSGQHSPTPDSRPSFAVPRTSERLKSFGAGVAEQFRPVGDAEERRFNPAGFILLAMLALVIFALVLSFTSLRSAWNFDPDSIPLPSEINTEEQQEAQTEAESEEASPEATEEPAEEPEDTPTEISIKEAITHDPSTGGGENQDLAALAVDGDPATIWRSMRYNDPKYAIKAGLGFSVVLEEESEVSEVTLVLRGKGGKVEIRAGDPRTPDEGTVLADGGLDGTTTFTFSEPVTTDTVVLWFPELPAAESDGMNRIELAEIELK